MADLYLRFFGQFQVMRDERPVTGFESHKGRALLAYLAMEATSPLPRSMLTALLWPDYTETSARASLRQALYQLRQVIGDRDDSSPLLLVTRHTLQWNQAAAYSLDAATFVTLLQRCADHTHVQLEQCLTCLQHLRQAVDLYQGDFLAGFVIADSAPFEEWRRIKQEQFHLQAVDTLALLTSVDEATGAFDRALGYARHHLALEPWREEAHRQIMRLLAQQGQRASAVAQYQSCRNMLATELGVEPSEATVALYEQIRTGTFPAQGAQRKGRLEVQRAMDPVSTDVPTPVPVTVSVTTWAFAARARELASLDHWLNAALAGQGRVAFITGEAGSGKSTLLREFVQRAQAKQATLIVAAGACDAQTGSGDPYLPFRELLRQLTGEIDTGWMSGLLNDESTRRLENQMGLAVSTLVEKAPDLIDQLVPGANLYERIANVAPQGATWLQQLAQMVAQRQVNSDQPSVTQAQLFAQIAELLQALAVRHPLLLLIDDLHWADASSLKLLAYLGRRIERSRILLVGTYRSEEVFGEEEEQHQNVTGVSHSLQRLFGNIHLNLDQVPASERRKFVDEWLDTQPNQLGDTFRQALFQLTEGHALFTTELVYYLQERSDLRRDDRGRWRERADLDWDTLPARIEGVIATRLDRLSSTLRRAVLIASVDGEEFTAEVIGKLEGLDETTLLQVLSHDLDRRHHLISAQRMLWIGEQRLSLYRFRHNLIQKYLYQSLDAIERAHLHAEVGNALETLYASQRSAYALQLARHFTAAGHVEKAVDYLHQAGEQAHYLSANVEAIEHFRHALTLLNGLPNSPKRAQRELSLQILLGNALIVVQGYAASAVGEAFSRARLLCQQLGDNTQLFSVLHGLHRFCYMRGDWPFARDLGVHMVNLAELSSDSLLRSEAHRALGVTYWLQGEFMLALTHFEEGTTSYDREHHATYLRLSGQDPGVVCYGGNALSLWCLGYVDKARQELEQSLTLAKSLAHPFVQTYAWFYAGLLHQFAVEPAAVQQAAEAIIALARQHGLTYYLGVGTVLHGWAQRQQGQHKAGITEMLRGMTIIDETGTVLFRHYYLSFLADAFRQDGQRAQGLQIIDEALAAVPSSGRFWAAELYRLQGELLLLDPAASAESAAEAAFEQAIAVTQQQCARTLELRATLSLCQLWQRQGKADAAQMRLSALYHWFSEGFDTTDLHRAQTMLANNGCG